MPEKSGRKEQKVILIAVALIAVVGFFTLFRPGQEDSEKNQAVDQPAVEYPMLSAGELRAAIAQKKNLKIFDTRLPGEFSLGHIIGSVNISSDNLKNTFASLQPSDDIILVGSDPSDKEIKRYAETFLKNGFKSVRILSGGFAAWQSGNQHVISWGNPESFEDRAKVDFIKPDELKKLPAAERNQVQILDVRPAAAFKAGSLEGAMNIPAEELESRRSELPKIKRIIVFGQSALDSYQAGVRLFDLGFIDAEVLEGGYDNWRYSNAPATGN